MQAMHQLKPMTAQSSDESASLYAERQPGAYCTWQQAVASLEALSLQYG